MKTNPTPIRSLTEEQVALLLKFAGMERPPFYWLVFFLLSTGLRVGEAVHVRWTDLLDGTTVKEVLHLKPQFTKTNKGRDIPLSAALRVKIADWAKYCGAGSDYWKCLEFPVLPGYKRHGYSVRRIEQIVRELGGISLSTRVTPHMLRHTFATRLMKVSDIRTVQTILGHVSITSTQIYLNPSMNDLKAAVDRL